MSTVKINENNTMYNVQELYMHSEYNLEFLGSVRNLQKGALFMKFYPEMP